MNEEDVPVTTTPIPAGALTVDDEAHYTLTAASSQTPVYFVRFAGRVLGYLTVAERARLLSPARPDGVPEDAVAALLWFGPETAGGMCDIWGPGGRPLDEDDAEMWRKAGVPVLPYQPAPDPADSQIETFGERLMRESSERAHAEFSAPPVAAGERTGPLGLSEAETRKVAGQDNSWVDLAVGTGTLARRTWDVAQEACRAAVVEWDAEPQPAETIDDIVADLRELSDEPDDVWDELADRIEAAAGLPQEPTEGSEQ